MEKQLIERILIGGNHLAGALMCTRDPASIRSYQEAQEKIGLAYADVWVAWRAIMDLSEDLRSKERKQPVYDGPERRNYEDGYSETIPLHGIRHYQPQDSARMKRCRRKLPSNYPVEKAE